MTCMGILGQRCSFDMTLQLVTEHHKTGSETWMVGIRGWQGVFCQQRIFSCWTRTVFHVSCSEGLIKSQKVDQKGCHLNWAIWKITRKCNNKNMEIVPWWVVRMSKNMQEFSLCECTLNLLLSLFWSSRKTIAQHHACFIILCF